jgi:D-alanyl-D-alanine carboxypeptidase (penicillin-binding protein 5/6)
VGLLNEAVLTLQRGKHDNLVTTVKVTPELVAPLAVGDSVGTVTMSLNDEVVLQEPLVVLTSIEPSGFFARQWDALLMFFANLFGRG